MLIKRLTLVVLCSVGLAVVASAQRGGGGARGSAGGHTGPAMGGGVGGAASRGPSSPPRFTGSRPPMMGSRPINAAPAFRANHPGADGRHNGAWGNGQNAHRRPYNGYHGGRAYPNVPWAGWSGATFIGYPGNLGFDDGGSYGGEAGPGENGQPPYADGDPGPYVQAPDPGQPIPYPQSPQAPAAPVDPPQPAVAAAPAPEPEPEDAVTLIFKNGRPAEQIHNYMLTRTTLYVRDQHHREIALADLDLAATKKANKDAGVDFQLLPETSH